jgi:hypothetical protein
VPNENSETYQPVDCIVCQQIHYVNATTRRVLGHEMWSMKSFFIPIGGSDTDEPLFATALAAARPFASHMNFFHVHIGSRPS